MNMRNLHIYKCYKNIPISVNNIITLDRVIDTNPNAYFSNLTAGITLETYKLYSQKEVDLLINPDIIITVTDLA